MFLGKGEIDIGKKIIKTLPLLWLLTSLCLLICGFYGYIVLLRPENTIKQAQQITHPIQSEKEIKEIQQTTIGKATYNETQIQPVTPTEYAEAQLNYEVLVNQWGIGSLYIPSSGIYSKILAGMSNNNLMVGLGTYSPDQALGKGNYVLMAHNLVQGGGVLRNLPQSSVGSIIYASDFSKIYEYVITTNKIVNKSEGNLLEIPQEGDSPLMTIFRCEGGLNTANRALIQAKYVRSYVAESGSRDIKQALELETKRNKTVNKERSHDQEVNSTKQTESINERISPDKDTKKAKQINKIEWHFTEKKSIYSTFEVLSILVFQLANAYSILVGFFFLMGLSMCILLTRLIENIGI